MRARGIRYREFSIYERNDRLRFGDQYRTRLRVLARVHFVVSREFEMLENIPQVSLVKSRPHRKTELINRNNWIVMQQKIFYRKNFIIIIIIIYRKF